MRTVLTDEGRRLLYIATLERDRIAEEEQVFSSLQDVEKPTLFDAEAGNEKVDKVNATASQTVIGAGLLLKVMAGDKINAAVFARYNKNQQSTTPGDNKAIAQQIAEAMNSSFAKQFSMHGASAKYITSSWMSGILSFLSSKPGEQKNPDNTLAHINWILLDDEQLKYVPESSGYQKVPQIEATDEKQLVQAEEGEDIEISRNGYIYIYVSNSSKIPMFFDDLKVAHTPGPLVEETHYYPFGLTQSGISSKAAQFGSPENVYKFNGGELNNVFNINQYEFFYRSYDPQIGRWHGLDTKPNEMVSLYAAMMNNPALFADPLGDTVAQFRPDGTFWRFHDDGKKEWTGIFYQKSTVTSVFCKDGVDYEVRTYSEGKAFQFNDAAVDVQGIKNGVINRIEFGTDAMIDNAMHESGVKGVAKSDGLAYSFKEGKAGGKMDYGIAGIGRGDFNKNTLYLRDNKAYDVADWGNYLFGRGMAELEVALGTVQIGAHYNNFANGRVRRTDATDHYDFGSGTYGSPGIFDSKSDQQAINNGYTSHPDYKNIIKRYYASWPKYNHK